MPLQISIVRTATMTTLEAAVFSGGSWFKTVTLNHSAVLVRHGKASILFDSGLGSQIDSQFHSDMPFWLKPFFTFTNFQPISQQLPPDLKHSIRTIYLSHVHWDHASGLHDFPDSCVAIDPNEMLELEAKYRKRGTFPTQFDEPPVRWCNYRWTSEPYMGSPKSLDIFGDKTAVLVPLPGHTQGSVGLFLKTKKRLIFFVGDLTWSRKALLLGQGKNWFASTFMDRDKKLLHQTMLWVRKLAAENPNLVVVPAHDSQAQDELGYYPRWIE
jgi:glyoxylase-like metal-dependent hydrolase (beta-lactamase superfamily II)